MHAWPARFADSSQYDVVDSLIAVGAVDNDGYQWSDSNYASYVNVYAPGVDIESAPGWVEGVVGVPGFGSTSGTSVCTSNLEL